MDYLTNLKAYQYELPDELIAQSPVSPRHMSRLMVVDRKSGKISEMVFKDLADFLEQGDALVFNNTKVIPARLHGRKETGGEVELFLCEPLSEGRWVALAKPARKLRKGSIVTFSDNFKAHIIEEKEDGLRILQFDYQGDFYKALSSKGKIPLPPYIRGGKEGEGDDELYQTVYAKHPGAVAAPTAGLHFTKTLLNTLSEKRIEVIETTLHVGIGTFRPVVAEDIRLHQMHAEWYEVTNQAAEQINKVGVRKQGRLICVGTTTCRILESVSDSNGQVQSGTGKTDIFIYPGYSFKKTEALLTNFHLPGSSLLMLVSALGGYELIKEAYQKAIKEKFRFYSYGDAMLIL